ncbi:MAG: GNAT family N-acetyltransferase [Cyanobacteria bacterium P01_A01_bin.123]
MIVREATLQDIPTIARVHVDSWQTTYRGIVPDEYLARLTYEHRTQRWHQLFSRAVQDKHFTYVAEHDSAGVVGFANGGMERSGDRVYTGELMAIYLLQGHQRQRLGYRLTQTVAQRLHQLGINSMLTWVLVDNPACQFYAALGGKPVREQTLEVGDQSFIEVAYGWRDTADLRG